MREGALPVLVPCWYTSVMLNTAPQPHKIFFWRVWIRMYVEKNIMICQFKLHINSSENWICLNVKANLRGIRSSVFWRKFMSGQTCFPNIVTNLIQRFKLIPLLLDLCCLDWMGPGDCSLITPRQTFLAGEHFENVTDSHNIWNCLHY